MNQIYLLQNQDKLFLSKHDEWLDGRDLGSLYKARHRDEALNRLFEVNAKDYSQRIHLLECAIKPNGLPLIDPEQLPPPIEKVRFTAPPDEGECGPAADTNQPQQPELNVRQD